MNWAAIEAELRDGVLFMAGGQLLLAQLTGDDHTVRLLSTGTSTQRVAIDADDLAHALEATEAGSNVRDVQALGDALGRIWDDPVIYGARRA
jgi:hypothetical protein